MRLSTEQRDGVAVVSVKGRLDVSSSPAFIEAMQEGEEQPTVLEMSELEYLSSAGLRALHLARKARPQLAVCGFNDFCSEIYEVSGFASIVPVYAKLDDALAALRG